MSELKDHIREGNKLMAEFLGYKYHGYPDSSELAGWRKPTEPGKRIALKLIKRGPIGECFYLCRSHNDLRFYNEYSWLMPVVEKIAEFMGLYINEAIERLADGRKMKHIGDLWEWVLECITHLNNHDKNQ